ncbi:DNA primase [Alteracholeplasma palmae J233]|uniref:DNA primase n=1 Tax=Alteracholeplasma palmae (strain ATCC 49389 / J233) TaxID=1318466 RepID=U4KRH3_ALTPJ|nr:DNA primase [Alteracholeplasma palmae]CCV64166.1 DNA primase [Alteracholeplasma palmae J233]
MDDKLISRINEDVNIVDLVSEFVQLEKKGKNYMGLCPFHQENSPSFSVSPEKNIAVCMSCKEGGVPLTFYRKIKNISFQQAVVELADRLGIEVSHEVKVDPNEHLYKIMHDASQFFQFSLQNTNQGEIALNYLKERQIEKEHIEHFKIGWAPKEKDALYQLLKDKEYQVSDMISLGLVKQNDQGDYYDLFRSRLIFPLTNPEGKVIGFSGRTLDKNEKVKYMNSPETPIFKKGEMLYHYNESLSEIRKTKKVILYEGFFDCIASYKAGLKNIVATMGTALTKQQALLLKKVSNDIVIAYDGDNAGQNAAIKGIDILQKENLRVNILEIPDKLDPDDYVKKYGATSYQSLFETNLKDPYAFKYDKIVKGKDLTNSNDTREIKNELETIFRYTDENIRNLYYKKALEELGIILKYHTQNQTTDYILPKPKETQRVSNKYEWIEIQIVYEVINSSYFLNYILERVHFYELSNWMITSVIEKIGEMYKTYYYDKIEIDKFLEVYPDFTSLINQFKNHFVFKENMRIETKEKLDEYIEMINVDLHRSKRIADLTSLVETATTKEEENKYLEEILKLQREQKMSESKRRI